MRTYWLIALIMMLTSCTPAKIPPAMPSGVPQSILTACPPATLTLVWGTPVAKPTGSPVPPAITLEPQWKALAVNLQVKAQQALSGRFWEDTTFKEEGYGIANKMIDTSTGKIKEDAREILKKFRWGMEFMDKGQLQEVIQILDRYN